MANADQFRTKLEPEDVEIPKEEHEKTEEGENETEPNMEESGNVVTDLDEDRPRSPLKMTGKKCRSIMNLPE